MRAWILQYLQTIWQPILTVVPILPLLWLILERRIAGRQRVIIHLALNDFDRRSVRVLLHNAEQSRGVEGLSLELELDAPGRTDEDKLSVQRVLAYAGPGFEGQAFTSPSPNGLRLLITTSKVLRPGRSWRFEAEIPKFVTATTCAVVLKGVKGPQRHRISLSKKAGEVVVDKLDLGAHVDLTICLFSGVAAFIAGALGFLLLVEGRPPGAHLVTLSCIFTGALVAAGIVLHSFLKPTVPFVALGYRVLSRTLVTSEAKALSTVVTQRDD